MQDEYEDLVEDANKRLCDLKFYMVTQPDGEKLIKIQLSNKNIVAYPDLIIKLIGFFRNPYNGSDFQVNY